MMFKEKSFGAAPPFLQLDDDSEEETEKEDRSTVDAAGGVATAAATVGTADNSLLEKIKTEMNVEHSMDSMMRIANEAVSNDSASMKSNSADGVKIKSEKKIIEDGASDISSDDEVLDAVAAANHNVQSSLETCTPPPLPPGSKAPTVPPPPPVATMAGDIKLEDDKMSLSSLSSTEEKSNSRSKTIAADLDPHKNVVPSMPGYYYPPTGLNHPYYYPNGDNATMYDPYGGYIQQYMGGFPPIIPANYVQSTDYPQTTVPAKQQLHGAAGSDPIAAAAAATEPKRDPSERIVAAVIDRVKTELKQILKKDFNKRMIESIAFKKYEAWWDEQVQKKTKSSTPAA